MGNGDSKGLSVNAKTIILILLFLNVGFAIKMVNRYKANKEAGYVREMTFKDQLQQRVNKAFGSAEEMKKIVEETTADRKKAEKAVGTLKAEMEALKTENAKLKKKLGKK